MIPGHTAAGEFVAIEPPRRLVYMGLGDRQRDSVPPGSMTVEFELVPTSDDAATLHAHGWDRYFERLTIVAAGGDPGADPWISGGDGMTSEDVVCDAPAGRIEGAEAYRAFMGPFVQILTAARMIAAFGDDETALVMYDTETVPVRSAPGAECVTVENGKIVYSRFVFDRAAFEAARKAVP